jgi:hypothetical protein
VQLDRHITEGATMAGNADHPITTDDEGFERELNRHRGDEQRRARAEAVNRLRDRGVAIGDSDSIDIVVELLEAVEAFERAVEAKGGDLMVDTRPARQPDNARFVLPARQANESLRDFGFRVRSAARQLANSRDD